MTHFCCHELWTLIPASWVRQVEKSPSLTEQAGSQPSRIQRIWCGSRHTAPLPTSSQHHVLAARLAFLVCSTWCQKRKQSMQQCVWVMIQLISSIDIAVKIRASRCIPSTEGPAGHSLLIHAKAKSQQVVKRGDKSGFVWDPQAVCVRNN